MEKAAHKQYELSEDSQSAMVGEPAVLYASQYSTPQSLEGDIYGKVYCYMKKR